MDSNSLELALKAKLEILLQKLSVDFSNLEVKVTEELNDEGKEISKALVSFSSADANLIIGHHGDSLQSIRSIIQQHIFKEFGEWVFIFLDVENYLEKRNDKLIEIAENASNKAKFLGKSIALYPMNSYERRVIHEAVSKIEGVESYSEGDSNNRHVIIANKAS